MDYSKEIGDFYLLSGEREYLFKPSFKNIAKTGAPAEIVEQYSALFNSEVLAFVTAAESLNQDLQQYASKVAASPVFGRKILQLALVMLNACCDDDLTDLIGEFWSGKKGLVYKKGTLSIRDIISLARHLALHGIVGNVDMQKDNTKTEYAAEFNAEEYINAARCHFGLSRESAENLTMTEFQLLIKAKYPDQKKKQAIFTEDEYDRIMSDYEENRKNLLKQN